MAKFYYVIRKHPWGGFCAFRIEDWFDYSQIPFPGIYDKRYETVEDAVEWANQQNPPLGVQVYDECWQ